MKRFIVALVCIVVIALIIIAVQRQYDPPTFFRHAEGGFNSLARRLQYIQSKLGIESYEFEFATPPDRKLIATFVAKLNGEIVPDLSHVFHIPPADKSEGGGRISIYFLHSSPYQRNTGPIWEIHFRIPTGGHSHLDGHSHTMSAPFDPSLHLGSRSTGTYASGVSSIRDGEDYAVWDYQAYSDPPDEALESGYAFSYRLNIRMEKLKEGEKIEGIRRVAFVAAE